MEKKEVIENKITAVSVEESSPQNTIFKASVSKPSNEDSLNRSSPDIHCTICLSNLENKSFTNSCLHQFCFTCLLQWSKVKAECPLCKQPFKSIIHNVRSVEDYDQYDISGKSQETQSVINLANPRFNFCTASDTLSQASFERTLEYENFRHAVIPHLYRGLNARHPIWNRPTTSDFRRQLYENGEWVRIQDDSVTRYCETSPDFYRRNPDCTCRLIPWLNRELIALLRNGDNQVSFVLELILALILRYAIRSQEFYEHISPYLHDRTSHFIHEFYNFARSIYDMVTYDEQAQYDRLENLRTLSNSSSPNSIIEVPVECFVDRPKINMIEKEVGKLAQLRTNLEVFEQTSNHSIEDLAVAGPSGTANNRTINNGSSHSDSGTDDDCIILEWEKPKSVVEKLPEVIELCQTDDDDDFITTKNVDIQPTGTNRHMSDFQNNYSSDSCSDHKETGNASSPVKVKLKSFLGTVLNVQYAPKTHNHRSHKKHKHKKSKSHKHHRHHKKTKSADDKKT